MRWLTRFCSIATLLSPPLIFPLFLFLALRSVDYEDTSSSLTAWPLLHVLMRSAYLHCIINKSEKWLFPLSFSHMFVYLSLYNAGYLEVSLEKRKWCIGGFPACLPSVTALTACAGSSPSNLHLHYLKGMKLRYLNYFLLWHYLF